ncbi:MAG: DNA polymerase III subunit alpha [bacterium]|nr:DNA polymerase III subunit alpha [bacterium]
MSAFVHLHCHSCHSFLEGASRVEELAERAAALGMEALALTDTNGLYGAVAFHGAARAAGIRPITGAEMRAGGTRAVILARNLAGYERLCALITSFHLAGGGAAALAPLLREELGRGDRDVVVILGAGHAVRLLRPPVPPSAYLEIPAAAGGAAIARLARLAGRLGIPPVATGPVLFALPGGHEVHRVLAAVRARATVATVPTGILAPPGAFLRSGEEMRRLFSSCPEAVENAGRIARSCDLDLPLGRRHLPRVALPPGETADGRLATLCRRGLAARYVPSRRRAAGERLRHELGVIRRFGFSPYFLVVHDIVAEARRRGIPTIGRGSAAGSIVSYCLGITHVDPVAHDLFFERFLNPERGSPPDIDLDFGWRRRDEMIGYVYRRHGADRVAMLSTLATFGARSAVREIGKALGVPAAEIDRWTAHLPHAPASSLARARALLPECRSLPLGREPLRTIARLAAAVDGFPRHLGVHTGGVVITPFPIARLAPLEIAAKGIAVTQYEMRAAEAIGLVKIDLLGQRSLAVLEDAVAAVVANRGVVPPVDRFGEVAGDEATRALIREGRTMGCFYIESPAMRQLLRKLDVASYEDLVAASSVIRPGVAESGMLRQYVARHRGREKTAFLHPALAGVLAATHGVMIYQEDVMRVAHLVAGMTLAEADLLRRAMSGKARSREAMEALERRFAAAASSRGIRPAAAAEIWRQIASFAGYAFCKAHSASFALLSMQVAYLKAHWPEEFMAAVLSNGGGFYHAQAYLDEARRMGIGIRPPDVNRSGTAYTAGPGWIRVGLLQVKGLKGGTMDRIAGSRENGGPFASLADFLERVRPDRREAEALVTCGACDAFGRRPALLRALHLLGAAPGRDETPLLPLAPSPSLPSPARIAPDCDGATRLAMEREALGVWASRHPLDACGVETGNGRLAAADLGAHAGERVELLGWIVCSKRVRTSRGDYMRFITMEDTTALFEIVLFPRPYRRYGRLLASPGPFAVEGRAADDAGVVVVNAERLRLLEPGGGR